MKQALTICKKPGRKDCVRITTEEDIPEFLKAVVKIEGNFLIVDSLEYVEKVPLGSVIAFEKLSEETMKEHNREHEMNVWNKADAATALIEIDGVFYENPKPVEAFLLDEQLPEEIIEILGEKLKLENGKYYLQTDWGVASAAVKKWLLGYL